MAVSPSTITLEDLLRQAHAGSPDALGKMLETCRQYQLMIAHQTLGEDLRAKVGSSDLVQEAFLDAHEHFPAFQGTTTRELLAWLTEILRCRLANVHRDFRHTAKRQIDREVRLDEAADVSTDETPSQVASLQEDARQLELAIARLPEDHRQVIVLRNKEHRSFEDIALVLNRSVEATRQLWKRAIRHLRQELDYQGNDCTR